MKTLTILRHAKSSWSYPDLSDHDRPLNKRGERDEPVMGERIKAAGIRPSLIISSTAVRAWTTAKVIARELNYPKEFLQREDHLYLASLDRILDTIVSQDNGFNSLMVVGHNPGLTDLVNFLQPGLTHNLPTAGVVSVQIDQDDWSFYGQPATELLVHDWPKKQPAPSG